MKYTCHECHNDFIDEKKEGCGCVIGTVCPYCKEPINIPVTAIKEEQDNGL